MLFFVFFFKQKTAYEMRISDWSSDVCSSDLHNRRDGTEDFLVRDPHVAGDAREDGRLDIIAAVDVARQAGAAGLQCRALVDGRLDQALDLRSEEHTSELQSLMRISYAVFCLKKKNTQKKYAIHK